jgi:hypothetical protein
LENSEIALRIGYPSCCLDIKDTLQWLVLKGPVAYSAEKVVNGMGYPLSPVPSPGTWAGQNISTYAYRHFFAQQKIKAVFIK